MIEGQRMNKYISLETLFKTVENYVSTHPVMNDNELFALFCSLPAADVREVKRGGWLLNDDESIATCSECECCVPIAWKDPDIYWNYCPNCGTPMR